MAKLDGTEQVLCVPAKVLDLLGLYQGFRPIGPGEAIESLTRSFAKATFLPRTEELEHGAEGLRWLQVIAYVLLLDRASDRCFAFRRPDRGGDSRLAGYGSIGVGGHLNPVDGLAPFLESGDMLDWNVASWIVRMGLLREVYEEVGIEPSEPQLAGLLYDGRNDVGQRHIGMICVARVDPAAIRPNGAEVVPLGWFAPALLRTVPADAWESWSAILVEHIEEIVAAVPDATSV